MNETDLGTDGRKADAVRPPGCALRVRRAKRRGAVLALGAMLAAMPAWAGRTDRDWMAPPPQLMIDMPNALEVLSLERVEPGDTRSGQKGAQPPSRYEVRLGTREEIRAALHGGSAIAAHDANASVSAVAALLERWRESGALTRLPGDEARSLDAAAAFDCTLFAAAVDVRHAAGAAGAMGLGEAQQLDMPLRCVPPRLPHPAVKAATKDSGTQLPPNALRQNESRRVWATRSWNDYKWPMAAMLASLLLIVISALAGLIGYQRYTRWDMPVQRPLT